MSWDYWKFLRHPVAAKKIEMRGINSIIFRYNYRFDPKLGKVDCGFFRILCVCPSWVAQLDND